MADRKYYVLCESNCKFESMTKEQILTAIAQAGETGKIKDIDSGFITTLKEQNGGQGLKMWIGTQAEYNALKEIAENCFYIITDDTTEADIAKTLRNMQTQIDGAYEKNDVTRYIELSDAIKEKNVEVDKSLYVCGNTVQLYVEIKAGIFTADRAETINVCKLKGYSPICPISVTCSGYGKKYLDTPSHANAELIPNGDGTANLSVVGFQNPSDGMRMTATWLI